MTEVVYYDTEIDIAVLRVARTSTDGTSTSAFAYLNVVGTGDVRPGDVVCTLGNPLGLGLAVSSGAYTYGNNMYLAVPADPILTADLTLPGKPLAEVAALETAENE